MDHLLKEIAAEMASTITEQVLTAVKAERMESAKQGMKFTFSEAEAAEQLNCNEQTLARRRKNGEIDYVLNPAGRPVYMVHHIYGYLQRREIKNGKQTVTMADVLPFRRKKLA